MAKNWMMNEAVRAIRNGDREAILDFGKRFPLSTVILAQLNDAGVALCDALPEKVTMRKIEAVLKGDSAEESDELESDVEEKEVPAKKAKKRDNDEMPEPKSWKGMNQYQKKKARALGEEYVAACKALDKTAVADDEEDDIPAPKKAAKKSKKPVVVEPEEDDDDEEDEEVVKKPAKKAKKEEKKSTKKPAKKVVEEDDEDDDDFDDFDLDDDDDDE